MVPINIQDYTRDLRRNAKYVGPISRLSERTNLSKMLHMWDSGQVQRYTWARVYVWKSEARRFQDLRCMYLEPNSLPTIRGKSFAPPIAMRLIDALRDS